MAKQDLVVKLMLDSGAFGNDIREAERKAKKFSDNINSAGKTAGEFSKEIGLSTGALGKLGSVITGAGGVVAAVGAFKSVMESTHGTSKQFHTNIEGCKAVLDSFQISLAKMNFTNFIDGLDETFEHAKRFKESLMDLSLGDIAYSYLDSKNMSKIKDKETEYRNAKTDSDRERIKKEAMDVVADMRKNLSGLIKQSNNAFVSGILSQVTKSGKINSTFGVEELLAQAERAFENTVDLDEKVKEQEMADRIMERYGNIKSALESTGGSAIRDDLMKSGLGRWMDNKLKEWSDGYAADVAFKDKVKADPEAYKAEMQDIIKNNQGLLVRNALYDYTSEELKVITSILKNAADRSRAVNEAELPIKGWSAGTAGSVSGGGTTVEERKAEEGSIQNVLKNISEKEKDMKYFAVGSKNWVEAREDLLKYKEEYEELLELQKKLEGVRENTPSENSIVGLSDNISNLENIRDTLTVGSEAWKAATIELYNYRDALAKVIEAQTEFDSQFEDTSLDDWNKKMDNTQIWVSSLAGAVDSLGNTFSTWDKIGLQAAADVTDMLTNAADGIMEFISIKQAAAAASATASAAGLPFPYNLAAIASVTSTILSVFDNIRTMAGRFAEGGIVGGTSYSGDKLFAMVNSGEMILNKRQQRNLSNMIGGGGQVEFHISGDSLIGVLNNGRNKRHLIS